MSLVSFSRKAGLLLTATICAISIFSFSSKPGGEGFEIYLNDRLLVQRYGQEMNTVQTVSLTSASATDKLRIRYHHCGKAGKNRQITLRNSDNKIVKTWTFKDGDVASGMVCPVGDILSLKKNNTTLKLYYSSSEMPQGRQLASVNAGANMAMLTIH
jgi:hypothetical protein